MRRLRVALRRTKVLPGRVPRRRDRINRDIRENEVRLIGPDGDHIGVVPIAEALSRAEAAALDLVEVSSSSRPYVCRIMDYGNFKYEQAKKQKQAKKKQHQSEVKEVKLRPRISDHDYDFKMRHARKFLLAGNKVKFVMMFRGRERSHQEFGDQLLVKVAEDLKTLANVEARPSREGRNLIMVVGPDAVGVKAEKTRLEKERKAREEEERKAAELEEKSTVTNEEKGRRSERSSVEENSNA